MGNKAIYAALLAVQQGLKAPKDKDGGKYSYRSAEDILEKVKPLLQENGLILLLDEAIKVDSVGSFIESTVTLVDIATGDSVSTHSIAREDVGTKFMSPGQATGAAVSYARKYALGGMFAIDNEQDIDSQEYQQKRSQTHQNRVGDAKSKKPSVPMQGIQKGKDSEFLRGQALKKVQNVQKFENITNEQVKAVISWKFGKNNWRDLNLDEACMLADMLPKYIKEMEAA